MSSIVKHSQSGKPARIAVVGGSGFIGRVVMQRLRQAGHDAWVVDKHRDATRREPFVKGDVRSLPALRQACEGAEVLIHLAAEHRDDVTPIEKYYEVNVTGTENVARVATQLQIKRIVFTSTVAVYGLPEGEVDETAEPAPFNHYGRSKLLAEQVLTRWCGLHGDRSLTIVRPTVVFGEHNRGNVYNLVRQIASGRFAMIGRGENRKSLAYVENVAAFLMYAGGLGPGVHVFNYADKPDLSVSDLVELIRAKLGGSSGPRLHVPYALGYAAGAAFDVAAWATRRKFPISRVRVRKFCASTQFCARKASESGFAPPVDLAEGIRRFIEHDFTAPRRRAA